MEITISALCRGTGKLFFRLDVSSLPADAYVVVGVCLPDGRGVPCMVFESGSSQVVGDCSKGRLFDVVVPQTAEDISVVVHAIDGAGHDLMTSGLAIRPAVAKWQSRLNGRIRPGELENLRNCDAERTLGRVTFGINDAVTTPEQHNPLFGTILVRGVAFIPCDLASEPPELVCLDESLHEISGAMRTWPARKASTSKRMTAPLWEIPFTAFAPLDSARLTFVARDRTTGAHLVGFESVERRALYAMVEGTGIRYHNAQSDPRWHEMMAAQRPGISELAVQSRACPADGPTFSIVVPLFRTPLALFDDLLQSVLRQSYGRWQLVLVNASSEDEALAQAVRDAAESDKRIIEVALPENRGITLNTAAGIAAATGDFIAFVDHDDVIEADALFEYASAVAQYPETDVLYCDEDKLSVDGRFIQPFFKPDFDIDLLRSNNYMCHMLCVRSSLLSELPERGSECDGAQDHDLALMAVEKARSVHHVPKVLYHWRQVEGSTSNEGNKPYAQEAGRLAVQRHLDRVGLNASVSDGDIPFSYRVDYAVQGSPLVSIVIPSCDHVDLLDMCLKSIAEKTTYAHYEVIVVENNSVQPETFEFYEQAQCRYDWLTVVRWSGSGFNYSELVNYGVEAAKGDYLLLLNNDIEVITPNWIEGMLGLCQRDDVGIVGVQLLFPDDTLQHGGLAIAGEAAALLNRTLHRDDYGYFALGRHIRQLSAVTAACCMVKREAFIRVGGFDTAFAVAFNDVDFCLRVVDAGFNVVYTPHVKLYHYESVSRGREDVDSESEVRFQREIASLREHWAHYYALGDPHHSRHFDISWMGVHYYWLRTV